MFLWLFVLFITSTVLAQDDPVRDPVLWDTVLKRHVSVGQTIEGIELNTVISIYKFIFNDFQVDYTSMGNDTGLVIQSLSH
jgi:hypothetical protein